MVRRFLAHLSPRERRRFQAYLTLTVIQGVLQAVGFLLLVPMLTALLAGDAARFLWWSAAILAVVTVHHAAMWFGTSLAYETAGALLLELHRRIGTHVARLPVGWFGSERTGPLGRLLSQGSVSISSTMAHLARPLVIGVVTPPVIALGLLAVDWRLGLVLIVGMAASFGAWFLQMRVISINERGYESTIAGSAGRIVEFARNQPVIRAFGVVRNLADPDGSRLSTALEAQYRGQRSMTLRGAASLILFIATLQMSLVAVIVAGVNFTLDGSLPLATLLAVIILAFRMIDPVSNLGEVGGNLQLAINALDRVDELLNTPLLEEPDDPATAIGSDVVFEDVTFAYDDSPVLDNVSFTAAGGSVTAIVGSSGSGKTTLLKLVSRFLDVDRGAIRIGGADVRDLGSTRTADLITPVFQDVYLFEGTLAENVRMAAPDCTQADLEHAARIARVDEILERFPDGWDTRIGEGGSTLSGGEKQRISIARALLKDAPVVLLDEATAALDPITESAVAAALRELASDRTVLVVAHRLPTVAGADHIVVLDQGRIVERGTHDELVDTGGRYRDFWVERERAAGWRLA